MTAISPSAPQDLLAPELATTRWFNAPAPLTLAALRGKLVMLHTFQMLCPGCVSHALPQAEKLHRMWGKHGLAVIGLHTVFEHHDAMTDVALEAFIHEYRLTFPIGVDQPGGQGPLPVTMATYGLRGTPSLVLIDHAGHIRFHHFGSLDDMVAGYLVGKFIDERAERLAGESADRTSCDDGACAAPS